MVNRFLFCALLLTLFTASAGRAYLPPITLPLVERVKISSHIFVGEVRDAYFIDLSGRKISPRQAAQQMDWAFAHRSFILPVIEIELQVREFLLWRKVKPQEFVLLRSEVPAIGYYQRKERANGLIKMLAGERRDIGKKFVFLTDIVSWSGRRTYFIYSGGRGAYGREEMQEKAAIQKAVKQWENKQKRSGKVLHSTAP